MNKKINIVDTPTYICNSLKSAIESIQTQELESEKKEERFLTRSEAAKKLKVSVQTISALYKKGALEGLKIGRRIYIKF